MPILESYFIIEQKRLNKINKIKERKNKPPNNSYLFILIKIVNI